MHTITFKDWYTWRDMTLKFHPDSSIDDWKDVFKTIMIFATWQPDNLDFLDSDD